MQCTTVKYVRGGLNLESILVSGNQANAFESASSATGYHLDYSKFFLIAPRSQFSHVPNNTSMFDSHASALLPARVSRHRFPFEAMSTPDVNIRKPRQWASCNAPHMLVCAGDVNTRKPPDKRLFFGLPQDTTVPPGDVAQLCVAQVSPRLGRVG